MVGRVGRPAATDLDGRQLLMRLVAGLGFTALAALLSGCPSRPATDAKEAQQPIPVKTLTVAPASAAQTLEAVGQAEGQREVEVRARVGGILLQRAYNEGDPVRAGQTLFRIDPAPFETALSRAEAQLAETEARVEQAEREAARAARLAEQNAISRKEADDAASQLSLARAQRQTAQAAVRQARLDLSYTRVEAPVSGISGRSRYSEGSLITVNGGEALTVITQNDPIWVRFSLPDAEYARLAKGGGVRGLRAVEAVLADGTVYPRSGRLNFAASQIDPRTASVSLRAAFDNPASAILPGQFIRIRLTTGERDGVFLVPQVAVLQSEKGRFVYVFEDGGKARKQPITTAGWDNKANWVVTEGLKPGERVVLDNLLRIKPDSRVELVKDGAPAKASTPAPTGSPPSTAANPTKAR
ncbi:MAG: efflux RND transporter periplasmic adaptor subunit [Betaproteobacteria bacterium]|nr:efflux RND transporter periplasmic adaptor subunit [Betaproteobacteria bacterium]